MSSYVKQNFLTFCIAFRMYWNMHSPSFWENQFVNAEKHGLEIWEYRIAAFEQSVNFDGFCIDHKCRRTAQKIARICWLKYEEDSISQSSSRNQSIQPVVAITRPISLKSWVCKKTGRHNNKNLKFTIAKRLRREYCMYFKIIQANVNWMSSVTFCLVQTQW